MGIRDKLDSLGEVIERICHWPKMCLILSWSEIKIPARGPASCIASLFLFSFAPSGRTHCKEASNEDVISTEWHLENLLGGLNDLASLLPMPYIAFFKIFF